MTHWRSLIDRDFLGSHDLVDKAGTPKDFTVQITKVEPKLLKTAQNPKGKRKCVMSLKGASKQYVANVTNCKIIENMYGPNIEGWVGKKITLYQGEVRDPNGGMTIGIKVRPRVPGGAAEEIVSQPVNEERRAEQAKAFGDEAGNGPADNGREPGSDDK